MKEGIGTFKLSPKGNTGFLYIPLHMVLDSVFPLREGSVVIKIRNGGIAIESIGEEILKRIGYWERFGGSPDDKVNMVERDLDLISLIKMEIVLEPLSAEAKEIRRQIACLEACHEHYVDNVKAILEMIGSMTPRPVLDCGDACDSRKEEAAPYVRALKIWIEADSLPSKADDITHHVHELLGERTDEKLRLVGHLVNKLQDNGYKVYADEDEDFKLTESRIQHLEICNYNWKENLHIVLKEIAAGKRLFDWHVPDGYNAHGDCPNRIPELRDILSASSAWADGAITRAGSWGQVLGEPSKEKRWLVASLCKHVRMQHKKHGGKRLLSMPTLR